MAYGAAMAPWDEDGARAIAVRQVRLARDLGVLDQLLHALLALAHTDIF
jgi:hypothetical protein